MGTTLTRIAKEFVFRTILENRHPVTLACENGELRCVLMEVMPGKIVLECIDGVPDLFSGCSEIRMVFFFHKTRMSAVTSLLEITERSVILSDPVSLDKGRLRTYRRVPAREEWRLTLALPGERIELDFPRTDSGAPVNEIVLAPGFDASRITDLVAALRLKLRPITSEVKIVMYRERKPATFEELITAKTGLMLYLPSSGGDYPEKDPLPGVKICTREMISRFLTESAGADHDITNGLRTKRSHGILSEIYCPILYQVYVVGYIYLMSSNESAGTLTPTILSFVQDFSRVFVHSLLAHGYFRTEPAKEFFSDARLIDISASGLLFSVPDPLLAKRLDSAGEVEIILTIKATELVLKVEIVRVISDGRFTYFGIRYGSEDQEKVRTLSALIYR